MSDKTHCVWRFSTYGPNEYAASTTCGSSFLPNKHDLLVGRFYEFCPRCGKPVKFIGIDDLAGSKDETYSKDRLYALFSTFMRERRSEENMTVTEFAIAYDISVSAVRNYEARGCLPSVPELLRILHLCNVSVYDVFKIAPPTGGESDDRF